MDELIELAPVESSNLAGIGYSVARQVLAVEFKPRQGHGRGPVFHYAGVDVGVYDELLGAASKGRFYTQRIKGKFTASRVTGPCAACGAEGPVGTTCEQCGDATHRAIETRYGKEGDQG
jgi:hypothetical protein